jgi:hypothetical protein
MEQLGFHWTNFHDFWILRMFLKAAEKIHISLKPDKHNG